MRDSKRFSAFAVLSLLLLTVSPEAAGAAEHERKLSPATPKFQQLQQQTAPRGIPGQPLQVAPGRPGGVVLRTHCNGTCMCTGADCTEDWRKVCKDGPTCSSDPGGANLVCTCVKKAAD